MGYFLSNSNLNNPEYEDMLKSIQNLPDVVLVKKVFPERQKRKPGKLRGLDKEVSDMAPRKQDVERLEKDYEMFLEALEEDEDMKQLLAGVEGLGLTEQHDDEMMQA